MGKKDKNKKKGKGAEKTAMKTDKKLAAKQKKILSKIGEDAIEDIVATLESEEARLKEVIETVCGSPSPRSNFTMVAHPEKDEFIIFGGEFFNGQKTWVYNDLFFYNINKKEWRLVKSPAGPAARSGHQMCAVAKDGGQLWVFGGEHASPSQIQFYHYKDLWVFGLTTKKWEKINAPNGPSPRAGHRMVATKKKLVIFGGFYDNNQSYKYFNDVHIFSMESYSWLKIDVSGIIVPPPRSGCCIAANSNGDILIWGGYTKSHVKKDIDRGVTHTDMFSLIADKSLPNEKFKWVSIKAKGYKPLPRSSVGVTYSANGKAYSFGGVMDIEEAEDDLRGQFGNELCLLDLNTTTWRLLEVNKQEKKVKSSEAKDSAVDQEMKEISEPTTAPPAVSSAIDDIFKITFGASSSNSQSNSNQITELSKSILEPSCRMNAGLCIVKGNLYIFGGIYEDAEGKQSTYNDLYSIDVGKLNEWKALIPKSLCHLWIEEINDSSSSGSGDDSADESIDDDSSSEMETE